MRVPLLILCTSLLLALPALAETPTECELPLAHADALQVARMFGAVDTTGLPAEQSAAEPAGLEAYLRRCATVAAGDIRESAGRWRYYLDLGSGSSSDRTAGPDTAGEGLRKLLPAGLDGPPQPVLARNALRVRGSKEAVVRFREIVDLLDRPLKRVELQVELLQGTAGLWAKLQGVDWNLPVSPQQSPVLLRFARGPLAVLRQRLAEAGEPPRLAATVIVENNRATEVRAAEALAQWCEAPGTHAPAARVTARAVSLQLLPRLNADGSTTMLVQAACTGAQTTTAPAAANPGTPVEQVGCRTQVRIAAGEAVLVTGLGETGEPETPAVGGASVLSRPVLLVTPRALEETP